MGAEPDEHAVFERLFESNYHLVLRYCYRRTGELEYARELTQEAFVVAWRRRRDAPDQVAPWLYGIARRVLADHWRAGRARPMTVPLAETLDPGGIDGAFEAVGLIQDLRRAFRLLSESDQEVLRLAIWEHLDMAGVARALGCGRSAAAVRLFRARQRLARLLDAPPPSLSKTAKAMVRGGVR